ncbi:hypothetical protein QQ045_009761 [Rhodiola kirilowii]
MKKAGLLEEKCKNFPKDISAASHKVLEVEAALLQAKAELEIMKGDQDDVYKKLAKLRESLESVNKDRMSLKAEEAHIMKKRVEAELYDAGATYPLAQPSGGHRTTTLRMGSLFIR